MEHGSLTGAVGSTIVRSNDTELRGNVDDHPTATAHVMSRGLRAEEDPTRICSQNIVPFALVESQRRRYEPYPGVVHKDV